MHGKQAKLDQVFESLKATQSQQWEHFAIELEVEADSDAGMLAADRASARSCGTIRARAAAGHLIGLDRDRQPRRPEDRIDRIRPHSFAPSGTTIGERLWEYGPYLLY